MPSDRDMNQVMVKALSTTSFVQIDHSLESNVSQGKYTLTFVLPDDHPCERVLGCREDNPLFDSTKGER